MGAVLHGGPGRAVAGQGGAHPADGLPAGARRDGGRLGATRPSMRGLHFPDVAKRVSDFRLSTSLTGYVLLAIKDLPWLQPDMAIANLVFKEGDKMLQREVRAAQARAAPARQAAQQPKDGAPLAPEQPPRALLTLSALVADVRPGGGGARLLLQAGAPASTLHPHTSTRSATPLVAARRSAPLLLTRADRSGVRGGAAQRRRHAQEV